MERPVLRAEIRDGTGKGNARKLRAKGLIPAIFCGPKSKAIPLVVDSKELVKTLKTEGGENVLIDLHIIKDAKTDRKVVMVKDIQIDPIQMKMIHTDFYEVTMDTMVTVEVPIHLIGKPEGTKMGGILEQVRSVIQVQSLPGDIPKGIDVDVSSLKIGDSIHVKDIQALSLGKYDMHIFLSLGSTDNTPGLPLTQEEFGKNSLHTPIKML